MARQKVSDYSEMPTIRFGEEQGDLGVGEEFQGFYKGCKTANTKYGEKKVHTFETKAGDVQMWGSTMLDRKLSQVGVGNLTFITYLGQGEKQRGKQPAKLFNVEQDREQTIHVDVPQVSFRGSEESDIADDVGYEGEYEAPSRAAPVPAAKPMATTPSSANRAKVAALLNRTKV
jgi:hypothetical protein